AGTRPAVLRSGFYVKEVETTGREYSSGITLQGKHQHVSPRGVQHFLFGMNLQFSGNRGPGRQFDPLKPLSVNSALRPRRFDEIPDFYQLGIYSEYSLSSRLIRPYSISAGLRGEFFNPQKMGGGSLIKSRNGSFWNPRLGLQVELSKSLQVRAAWGYAAKGPALLHLYPAPLYVDVLETGRMGLDTLMTTYVYNLQNEELKAYRQQKAEISLDYVRHPILASLTFFRQNTTGIPWEVQLPYTLKTWSWPNWPSAEGREIVSEQPVLVSGNSQIRNLGWVHNKGAELLIKSQRIPPFNLMLQVSGSYVFTRNGAEASRSVSAPQSLLFPDSMNHTVFPVFPFVGGWRDQFIFKYKLDYLNKNLGLWLTFSIFHKPLERQRYFDKSQSRIYAAGYFEDDTFFPLSLAEAQKLEIFGMLDPAARKIFRHPANYFFNLTLSKSLMQGMEMSLFMNNFFNRHGFYLNPYGIVQAANPEIFYGIEFSILIQPFVRSLGQGGI
ncbi:MAG: TonB-dependent receptor, partial [Calditrichia bacterium]